LKIWEDVIMGSEFHHDDQFSKAEFEAIQVHKYYLSQKAGHDIGLEYAIADWLKHHATAWRQKRLKEDLDAQIREINKHKWIESKKAGRDLGSQAVFDWVDRFAAGWRQYRDQEPDTE
jgi:hypothetical protein